MEESTNPLKVVLVTYGTHREAKGRTTRALALYRGIQKALDKAGLLPESVEFTLIAGRAGDLSVWQGGRGENTKTVLPLFDPEIGQELAEIAWETVQQKMAAAVEECQPDVLLADNIISFYAIEKALLKRRWGYQYEDINPVYKSPLKNTKVWVICRNDPSNGIPCGVEYQNIVDRLYYIENFRGQVAIPPLFGQGFAGQRTRTAAQRAGRPYESYNPNKHASWEEWNDTYELKEDRKLLAPVVNLWADDMLSREEARNYLLDAASVPVEERVDVKAIVLCAASIANDKSDVQTRFNEWFNSEINGSNSNLAGQSQSGRVVVVYSHAQGSNLLTGGTGRYLRGADYFFSTAGYNSFYEARWAAQNVKECRHLLQAGRLKFIALKGNGGDQEYRARTPNQTLLIRDNSGKYTMPGNGADQIAEQLMRQLEYKLTAPVS